MKHFPHTVAGEAVSVQVPEDSRDLDAFRLWVRDRVSTGEIVACDTETTGLDTFSPTFRLRAVQFGTAYEAWVLPVEISAEMLEAARWALRILQRLTIHNAPYDLLVLDRHAGIPLELLGPRVIDTRVLAHLCDPRQPQEGGVGLALKALCAEYVDPTAPDTQGDLTAIFNGMGMTKSNGFAKIHIWHETYLLYAGLDVILGSRILPVLQRRLTKYGVSGRLVDFEHRVMRLCATMERRGMRVDQDYVRGLVSRLEDEAGIHSARALRYGVTSVNATAQVSAALLGMGEKLTQRTPSGALKVDKAILLDLADLDDQWQPRETRTPNPLADAVLRSKRAGKWRTSYGIALRDGLDSEGRSHCKINSLQARTARMSISNPPLQQLPSGDWTIRRALMADPGHRIISVDYSAVEMRILASLADETQMKRAIAEGRDLHDFTAELIWGPGFTKRHRKMGKGVGFGKVYGGGATTLSRQTGAPLAEVQAAIAAYDRVYPGIKRYSRRVQREARAAGYVVWTPSGRRLPLDRDRVYAATNYAVQSTARDVLCQALLDLEDAGLADYMLLPVHDELVAQAPEVEAEEIAREIGRIMAMDFAGVQLDTDPDVGGASWGSLYMKQAGVMTDHDSWYAAHPDAAHAAELARA
ncbi:DNA polymerase [Kitasatospora sp. NPDC050543]|uniref:DNA polymerase n=1 Tax=Kitasatospora sp. NPDC050543 TaxID=3364054 RepID=UPI00379EFE43